LSVDELMLLAVGWPVLLCTGIVLGFIALRARERRAHLLWYFPVLLFAALAFLLLTGGAPGISFFASEQLGVGVVAVIPAVLSSFIVAWYALEFRAPAWLLALGPAVACLISAPVVGYVASLAVCELTGECF